MHTCDRTYIYHIYAFYLKINNTCTLKNTHQERSFCVIYEALRINLIKGKIIFFGAIITPCFTFTVIQNVYQYY